MEIAENQGRLRNVMNVLTGRPARNIYFWTAYFLNFFQNYREFAYGAQTKFLLLLGIILFLCVAVYPNNLWLLPRYFKKKLYKQYFVRFTALLLLSASGLLAFIYLFDAYFPLEPFYELALISLGPSNIYQAIFKDPSILPQLFLGSVVSMLMMYFFFFMAWFMNDYFVQQKRLEQALKEKLETDLALMKYQVSPHFLFNTLNNLYGMSLIRSEHLPKSLLDLASILRYILYESETQVIAFNREKEIMEAYIQLELLRLHNTENMQFRIEADSLYSLPPLLWLPVLENTFKHGTRHIAPEHFINFKLSIKENIWHLESKNTFKPMNEEYGSKSMASGIGLQNLRKRLAIIYPNRHELREQVEGNLYSISVKIDLND